MSMSRDAKVFAKATLSGSPEANRIEATELFASTKKLLRELKEKDWRNARQKPSSITTTTSE